MLTGIVWVICDAAGPNTWWSTGISFVAGYTIRVIALHRAWEEHADFAEAAGHLGGWDGAARALLAERKK